MEITQPAEEKSHGTISMATYYKYFKAGANVVLLAVMVALFLIGEASLKACGRKSRPVTTI